MCSQGGDITCSCSDSPEDIGRVVSSSTCTCLCQAPVQLSCISMKGTVTKVTITAAPSFTFGSLLALWRCGGLGKRILSCNRTKGKPPQRCDWSQTICFI